MPALPSPARAGLEATVAASGDTTGAAPRIGAVGRARPALLMAAVPRDPVILQRFKC